VIGRSVSAWLLIRAGVRPPSTQTSEEERRCLARHAAGRRRIVEIGVYHGANTALLRSVAAADGEVVGIDPHEPGRLGVSFEHWIAAHQLSRVRGARARLLRQYSHDAAATWSAPIDFLFIDGDHSWSGVSRDWSDWTRYLEQGGIVALHDSRPVDAHPDFDSVRFTREVVQRDARFEMIDEVDSLTVLRRRSGSC